MELKIFSHFKKHKTSNDYDFLNLVYKVKKSVILYSLEFDEFGEDGGGNGKEC